MVVIGSLKIRSHWLKTRCAELRRPWGAIFSFLGDPGYTLLSFFAAAWLGPAWRIPATGVHNAQMKDLTPHCCNHDDRPPGEPIRLIVIHAISLPPDEFGGPGVEQLFTNALDPDAHPYYATIDHLRVSAHYFIRRDGETICFVDPARRAWHAGVSCWNGRERCNDFSIGIELEGCDTRPFEPAQYERLIEVFKAHDIGYFFYNGGGDSADTSEGKATTRHCLLQLTPHKLETIDSPSRSP